MALIDLESCRAAVARADPFRIYGRVTEITGVIIHATGLRVSIGEACRIFVDDGACVDAEVVGFKEGKVLLMAVGDLSGIRPGSKTIALGRSVGITVSDDLVGRVLNDRGQPMDGGPPIKGTTYPLVAPTMNPLQRQRITQPLDLGIRAINGLLTCGRGQRIGIMAGSGVGKSVLLGMISRYTEAAVNVIGLIGERSREVREFIEKDLGSEGLVKSVVIVSTSEQPSLAKVRGAFAATAIAEFFRDQGREVLLLMDSLTRVAQAQREIGLAIGEPPTAKGYTPSVFALLPKLLERVGTSTGQGSISGIYTVLVEGDDLSEPVADAARAVLDGHIVLSRDLAMEGLYPSIDVLRSISRIMPDIAGQDHRDNAGRFIDTMATYRKFEDMISIGAYKEGANPKVDYALRKVDGLKGYIRQDIGQSCTLRDSIRDLAALFSEAEAAS